MEKLRDKARRILFSDDKILCSSCGKWKKTELMQDTHDCLECCDREWEEAQRQMRRLGN